MTERVAGLEELSFMTWLKEQGYGNVRPLADGKRWAATMRLMFTTAIITGNIGDYSGIEDRWCYETPALAQAALDAWDGTEREPQGWHRHPMTGRRRRGGNPALEYVEA